MTQAFRTATIIARQTLARLALLTRSLVLALALITPAALLSLVHPAPFLPLQKQMYPESELEAALSKLNSWRPSTGEATVAQQWIDWLDKVRGE